MPRRLERAGGGIGLPARRPAFSGALTVVLAALAGTWCKRHPRPESVRAPLVYTPVGFRKLPDYDRGEPTVTTWSMGIKVTLWIEKGVLFALTEDPVTESTDQ